MPQTPSSIITWLAKGFLGNDEINAKDEICVPNHACHRHRLSYYAEDSHDALSWSMSM